MRKHRKTIKDYIDSGMCAKNGCKVQPLNYIEFEGNPWLLCINCTIDDYFRRKEDPYQNNRDSIIIEFEKIILEDHLPVENAKLKHSLKKYGLTIDKYRHMFASQEGNCKVCKKKSLKRRLSIDHCHISGKIRGLLCTNCNLALGFVKEDVNICESLIQYIKEFT